MLDINKKNKTVSRLFFLVACPGLEPGTPRLKVLCSTNWASRPYLILNKQQYTSFFLKSQDILRKTSKSCLVGRVARFGEWNGQFIVAKFHEPASTTILNWADYGSRLESKIYNFAGKHQVFHLPQNIFCYDRNGRGGRIRTYACKSQSLVPYRLATPL